MRIALFTMLAILVAIAVVWFGNGFSSFGTPVDPNSPDESQLVAADVLKRTLSGTSDSLLERVHDREISDDEFKDRMATAAQELLGRVDASKIPAGKEWEYGEMYITAREWSKAKAVLEKAVRIARDEDRRVNDSLRLARVYAELNDVKGAMQVVGMVTGTKDSEAAPILPAMLYEIVPAAEKKGADAELAAHLEQAIACEQRTIVDPTTVAGRDFLSARPFHIRRAWNKVISLYDSAGETVKAQAAREKFRITMDRQGIA